MEKKIRLRLLRVHVDNLPLINDGLSGDLGELGVTQRGRWLFRGAEHRSRICRLPPRELVIFPPIGQIMQTNTKSMQNDTMILTKP